jgi:hypothetical protein
MTERPAKDATGMLIYNPIADEYVFRIYQPDYSFVDYKIRLEDLEIQIKGDYASLYESEGENYLDYPSHLTKCCK